MLADHTHSPSSTSSSVSGALRMASQVFCMCMRENAEYMDSNEALIIVLEQITPAARKAMYDMPPTSWSMRPSPYPRPNM